MRSSQFHRRAAAPCFFTSSKCEVAIPIHNVLLRDALQQASLDSEVRAIRYRQAPDVHGTQISLTGVIIERIDGRFILAFCKTRPHRHDVELARIEGILQSKGLRLLERDPSDIRRDPLFSNTREIWSHERYYVPLNDRLKISAVLEDGPQSILEIEERARPSCDILRALCALACENLVEISIHERPLGPNTVVSGRHSR
jgi:hypothetical protein